MPPACPALTAETLDRATAGKGKLNGENTSTDRVGGGCEAFSPVGGGPENWAVGRGPLVGLVVGVGWFDGGGVS